MNSARVARVARVENISWIASCQGGIQPLYSCNILANFPPTSALVSNESRLLLMESQLIYPYSVSEMVKIT